MAECFIYSQSGNNGETKRQFDMTDITHYYDESTIDTNNNLWIDSINGNNIDLSNCVVNTDNIELPSNTTKTIFVSERPSVLYCVVKKEEGENDAMIFGISESANNSLNIWVGNASEYNNRNYMVSCTGSPYMFTKEVVPYGQYNVFAMWNYATGYAGDVPIASFCCNGEIGQSRECKISTYTKKEILMSAVNVPTNFKMVAISHTETDILTIVNNCKYLCEKYNIGD